MSNLGVHVYYLENNLSWEFEKICVSFLSAMSWKKYMGPIHLYCNKNYLEILKKWGVDKIYDKIDTTVLENLPLEIDYKQYWAYSKLFVIQTLKSDAPFTILDCDLWLSDKIRIDTNLDCTMYHYENYDGESANTYYPDFDFLVPDEIIKLNFDKSLLPTNCALLHINNPTFIDDWIDLANRIAIHNKDIKADNNSIKMILIEQRLLPMYLSKMNYKYGTFINTIYQGQFAFSQDGSNWKPKLSEMTPEELLDTKKIKHLWGYKRFFPNHEKRNLIMKELINRINELEVDKNNWFPLLYELEANYSSTYEKKNKEMFFNF